MTFESSPGAVRTAPSRTLWIVGGVLGLVSLAAAGTDAAAHVRLGTIAELDPATVRAATAAG